MATVYFDDAEDCIKSDALYFIREGDSGPVKIGRGKSPHERRRKMQVGNSSDLVILAAIERTGWQEAFWHACFADSRIRGEWFEATGNLLAAITAAAEGTDWTEHAPCPPFDEPQVWHEHLIDALEAFEEATVLMGGVPEASARAAVKDWTPAMLTWVGLHAFPSRRATTARLCGGLPFPARETVTAARRTPTPMANR